MVDGEESVWAHLAYLHLSTSNNTKRVGDLLAAISPHTNKSPAILESVLRNHSAMFTVSAAGDVKARRPSLQLLIQYISMCYNFVSCIMPGRPQKSGTQFSLKTTSSALILENVTVYYHRVAEKSFLYFCLPRLQGRVELILSPGSAKLFTEGSQVVADAKFFVADCGLLKLHILAIQRLGVGWKILTDNGMSTKVPAIGSTTTTTADKTPAPVPPHSATHKSFADIVVHGHSHPPPASFSSSEKFGEREIFYSDDSSCDDLEEHWNGVARMVPYKQEGLANAAEPAVKAADATVGAVLPKTISKLGRDVLAFKIFIQILAVEEDPYAGVHCPELLVYIKKFIQHRELANSKKFTFDSLSDLLSDYPRIFRNKGCSRTSEWGKVTVRPLGLGLLAGVMALAANAVKLEQQEVEAGLMAATQENLNIEVVRSGLLLSHISGSIQRNAEGAFYGVLPVEQGITYKLLFHVADEDVAKVDRCQEAVFCLKLALNSDIQVALLVSSLIIGHKDKEVEVRSIESRSHVPLARPEGGSGRNSVVLMRNRVKKAASGRNSVASCASSVDSHSHAAVVEPSLNREVRLNSTTINSLSSKSAAGQEKDDCSNSLTPTVSDDEVVGAGEAGDVVSTRNGEVGPYSRPGRADCKDESSQPAYDQLISQLFPSKIAHSSSSQQPVSLPKGDALAPRNQRLARGNRGTVAPQNKPFAGGIADAFAPVIPPFTGIIGDTSALKQPFAEGMGDTVAPCKKPFTGDFLDAFSYQNQPFNGGVGNASSPLNQSLTGEMIDPLYSPRASSPAFTFGNLPLLPGTLDIPSKPEGRNASSPATAAPKKPVTLTLPDGKKVSMLDAELEISEWSGNSRGRDEDGDWVQVEIKGKIRLRERADGWSLVGIETLTGPAAIAYV